MISAIPSVVDLHLSQGSDTEFECSLVDESDNPMDITLDTVTLIAWDYLGGTRQVLKTNGPGGHTDPTNGLTTFVLLRSDYPTGTARLDWVYEVKRAQPDTTAAIHIQGRIVAEPAGA